MRGHISQACVGGRVAEEGGGGAVMLPWCCPVGNVFPSGRLFSQSDLEENSMVSTQGVYYILKIIHLDNFLNLILDAGISSCVTKM